MERIEFIDNYLALDNPVSGRRQTKQANDLLPAGAQEKAPLGTFSRGGNKVTSLQTGPLNLLSQAVNMATTNVPPVGLSPCKQNSFKHSQRFTKDVTCRQ